MTILKVVPLSMLVAIAVVSGCSQSKVSIGEEPDAEVKTGIDAFAGNWDGYIEAYSFNDGTDQVRITVNSDETATIRFGAHELWPPPTDPNVTFPPDFSSYVNNSIPDVWSGFSFSLNDVHAEDTRLQATAASNQVFVEWCKLQPSHETNLDATLNQPFSCADCPGWVASTDSSACIIPPESACPTRVGGTETAVTADESEWVNCLGERETLCQTYFDATGIAGICRCDASGCALSNPAQNVVLDIALQDNRQTLTGTLVLPVSTTSPPTSKNYIIVLKRQ